MSGQLTIVDGQVADYYTNTGIPNVMLVFVNEDSNSDPFAYSHTYYDTIFTDSLGKYHYEFVNDTLRSYFIEPISNEQYYSIRSGNNTFTNFSTKYVRLMTKTAWLPFRKNGKCRKRYNFALANNER